MKIHIIKNDELDAYQDKTKLRLVTKDFKESFIAEDSAEYNTDKYKNHFNDKIMRKILKDKYQAAIYLNDWLKIKPKYEIKPEDLEEVTESYITHTWSNKETDIVYKDKKYDGVFYLIEHQTKVDYLMAKRIEEYKNEIQNHYELNRPKGNNKKSRKVANVIAIVIYIEDKKWKAKRNLDEIKIVNPRVEGKIEDDYALISINEYSIEDLKEKLKRNNKNIILKLALINKIAKINDSKTMIKEIKNIKIREEEIDYIASYINERISKKCGKDVAKLMIKNIEREINEEEEKNMLEAFVDRFLKEGKEEGLCQVAINMLKEKCDKALIKKYTGLSDAKIAKLEKTLQRA